MVSALEDLSLQWPGCAGCGGVEPPDSILQIPPPPLPHFLQLALALEGNNHSSPLPETDDQLFLPPCNPRCDWSNAAGVELVELSRRGVVGAIDDTWFLVLVASSVAFILLGALLTFALLRCKQQRSLKSQMEAVAAKVRPLDSGHCDQHSLWAALTTKGTPAHFAVPPERKVHHGVDFCRPSAPGFGYYGAIEPHFSTGKGSQPATPDSQIYTEIPDLKMTKLSSFENIAYDEYANYEDVPIDTYPMAEVSRHNTLSRFGTARPLVSGPTKIDASSLPPLNQKRQRNLPNI